MASSSDHLKMIQDFPVYPTLRQISLMADQCGVSDLIAAKKLVHLALATFGAISLPVSVAERLPGAEDCDAKGRCWWLHVGEDGVGDWFQRVPYPSVTDYVFFRMTHWLPHYALPLPVKEVEK